MAGPLPFLVFGGVEVANAARTLGYLRRGLGNTSQGRWELGDGDVSGVLYRQNGFTCSNPEPFVSPMLDPAPWYDPTEPGSSTFLGVVLLDIDGYDSTVVRTATQRMGGLGGGTLSAQYRKPRTWTFKAALVSSDDAGAEYGLRWLTGVLEATQCDGCETSAMQVRLASPPEDCSDDSLGLWTAYESALTMGPRETQKYGPAPRFTDALGACRDWVEVQFEVTSGNPWLYRDALLCLSEEVLAACDPACPDICTFLTGSGNAPCCTVDSPLRGVDGAIFTLRNDTSTPFGQVQLESHAVCGDASPLLALLIDSVPAFSTVVVDSSRHTITEVDAAGVETDAQHLVVLSPGQTVEWIEIAACEAAACLCANPIGGVSSSPITVEIEIQHREG